MVARQMSRASECHGVFYELMVSYGLHKWLTSDVHLKHFWAISQELVDSLARHFISHLLSAHASITMLANRRHSNLLAPCYKVLVLFHIN